LAWTVATWLYSVTYMSSHTGVADINVVVDSPEVWDGLMWTAATWSRKTRYWLIKHV